MLEIEKPRNDLIPTWMGEEMVELMGKSGAFFKELGHYPLPPTERGR
jgi:hypothetical protein